MIACKYDDEWLIEKPNGPSPNSRDVADRNLPTREPCDFLTSLDFFGGLRDFFGGLLDFFGGLLDFFGGLLDFFGGLLDFFGGLRDFWAFDLYLDDILSKEI
jgi:hypothetical protein